MEIQPIPGNFEPESSLMWQLELLKSEELAKKWYKGYLSYHGKDEGLNYMIGYFANVEHSNNLRKWFYK